MGRHPAAGPGGTRLPIGNPVNSGPGGRAENQPGPRLFGAGGRSRTLDLRITNALLYQLSYTGTKRAIISAP